MEKTNKRKKRIPKVRCKACGGKIVIGHEVIELYQYYHKNCLDSIKKEVIWKI